MIHVPAFLLNLKLEWLQIAILKQSHDLSKTVISLKNFTALVQMYFQSSSEWFLHFRTYDTRCLHFYWISNWSNCRSLFWSNHVTLVKSLVFVKLFFTAIVQMYFENFPEWFSGFKTYNTRYLVFVEYQTGAIADPSF